MEFYCEQCDCEECVSLGSLGNNHWVRCRACGWDQVISDGQDDDFDGCDEPYQCHDMSDDAAVLAGAGMGTDEDYGHFSVEDY
jgi:hypothetical protein